MARKDPADLSSYVGKNKDPQLLTIWKEAISHPVRISVGKRAQFQRLRFKLYELRLILKAENNPLYDSLKLMSISSERTETGFTLIIGSADLELREELVKAGFPLGGKTETDPDYYHRTNLTPEEDDFLDPTKPAPAVIPERFRKK